jgi:hypothetical protein
VNVVAATPQSQPRGAYGRQRRGFPILRVILLCWLVVFALKSLRHVATQSPAIAPAPVIVSQPPSQIAPEFDTAPDLSTLDAFIAWRADHAQSKQSRKALEGRDVRWTGTLKKSLIPGRYDLVQDVSQGKGSVRLLPATDDAKQDLRRLEPGVRVEIEGILMDERSLHLVTVHAAQ